MSGKNPIPGAEASGPGAIKGLLTAVSYLCPDCGQKLLYLPSIDIAAQIVALHILAAHPDLTPDGQAFLSKNIADILTVADLISSSEAENA